MEIHPNLIEAKVAELLKSNMEIAFAYVQTGEGIGQLKCWKKAGFAVKRNVAEYTTEIVGELLFETKVLPVEVTWPIAFKLSHVTDVAIIEI